MPSRQYAWQQKQLKAGLCKICGKKQWRATSPYCEAHRLANRVLGKKYAASRRENAEPV